MESIKLETIVQNRPVGGRDAKLEHGEQVDPVQLLEDWVAIGDITADEGALVERVIAVVNARPEWLG